MPNLNLVFSALGDETRRAIVDQLQDGEKSLSELAKPFDMSQTAVTKHVKVLTDAGLVAVNKRGRTRFCSLDASPLRGASEWLENYETFWTQQLESLDTFLKENAE